MGETVKNSENKHLKKIYGKIARYIVNDTRNWRKIAIFTYRNNYKKFKLSPEMLAISIARELWINHDTRSILMINANNIKLSKLIEITRDMKEKSNIFRFGIQDGEYEFLPKIKIKINDIIKNSTLFTKIIKSMAPEKSEKIDETIFNNIRNIDDLSKKLIKNLKPPSINETIGRKILEKTKNDKVATIMEVIGIVGGAVIQPFTTAPRGIKMIREIVDILKTRKREFYKEWEAAIKNSFQPETVNQLFSSEEKDFIINSIKQNGYAIILNSTINTIYEPFSYYLLYNAIEMVVNEIGEVGGILTNSEDLAQLPIIEESIRCELEGERSVKMTYIFENEKIANVDPLRNYINDRVILFDMKTSTLMKLFFEDKATSTGELIHFLARANRCIKYGELAILMRDYGLKGRWHTKRVPIETGIKAWLKRTLSKILDKITGQYI